MRVCGCIFFIEKSLGTAIQLKIKIKTLLKIIFEFIIILLYWTAVSVYHLQWKKSEINNNMLTYSNLKLQFQPEYPNLSMTFVFKLLHFHRWAQHFLYMNRFIKEISIFIYLDVIFWYSTTSTNFWSKNMSLSLYVSIKENLFNSRN